MVSFLKNNWPLVITTAVIFLLLQSFIVFTSYRWGANSCELKQSKATVKETVKTRKAYEKINRALPSDADTAGIADFLLRRTVNR